MPDQQLSSILEADSGLDGAGVISNPSKSLTNSSEETDAFQFLSNHISFAQVSAPELKALADASHFETFLSGDYLSIEGDIESSYGFILVSGRIGMTKTSINGKELIVELLAAGDIFGLILALSLEKLTTQLSARAQTKSQVLWIPSKNFVSLINNHSILYRECFAHLLHSLQSSYGLSRGLAHDRVEVRIATILVTLARRFSRRLPAIQDQTIDITRQQIADLTGTTAESAIRVTRAMQRKGLINIKRPGIVRVLNLDALQALAEGE